MDKFIVFEVVVGEAINPIGIIENYISLMYTKYSTDTGSFELFIPYSQDVLNLVKRENDMEKLILLDEKIVGICQKINPQVDSTDKRICIQGTLIEGIMDNYCTGLISRYKTATSLPQNLLNFPLSLQYVLNVVAPNISGGFWSEIDYELPTDYTDQSWSFADGYVGGRCSINKYIQNAIRQLNKCYSLDFQDDYSFKLNIYTPKNRTINQSVNSPVIISTKFGDILSSSYSFNSKDYKNIIVAYTTINDVYYEQVVTYDDIEPIVNYPDEKKRVAYVEIVDITSEDDEGNELTEQDILGLLKQKGKEELYNFAFVSEYSCSLNQNTNFKLGVDYNLGDKITIQDKELDMLLDAEITGYTVTKSAAGETFEPIIGIPQPTLTQMLKRKGVI